MKRPTGIRVSWSLFIVTFALLVIVLIQVLRTATDQAAANFVAPTMTACAVLLAIFVLGFFIHALTIHVGRTFAWLVGFASLLFAFVPWLVLTSGNTELAATMYRGLRIPQGIERFWDLSLVLQSVDCDAWGFNVFVDNNGCLKDAAIYGPGMLWLNKVPFDAFSFSHVLALGVAMMVISSVALVWLARESAGLGQIVLLVAALGAPWLLLLERGNIDAVLIWVAVLVVVLVRGWPNLWVWSIAAIMIWVVGTWKYYPFAMGIMLLPVIRLRRGWMVFGGWLLASLGYVLLTWSNFKFSMQSNSNMTEIGDYVVLGRVPVVARMFGSVFPAQGIQLGDFLVALLAVAAVAWGVASALRIRTHETTKLTNSAVLAAAGSALFLSSVLVGGFGWAYKAAFLLLCIPIFSWIATQKDRLLVASGFVTLALVAVCSIVVWNTLLASLAGIIAASFGAGVSVTLLVAQLLKRPKRTGELQTGKTSEQVL
jgi:hypothetical protein